MEKNSSAFCRSSWIKNFQNYNQMQVFGGKFIILEINQSIIFDSIILKLDFNQYS